MQLSVDREYALDAIHATASSSTGHLRRWLGGRWSLLFSHPEDFAAYGFEADRWVSCLCEELERLDLTIVAASGGARRSWVSQVGGCFIPSYEIEDLLPGDWQVNRHEHFVTVLDGELRARRTIIYSAGTAVPSPIDLAQTAAGLRARGLPRQFAAFCKAPRSPRARASRP